MMQSRSGCAFVIEDAQEGISDSLLMSKTLGKALSLPCLTTSSSSLSFRRPTMITFVLVDSMRSAKAYPMPDVAPMRRTFLYWNGIVDFLNLYAEIKEKQVYLEYSNS